MALLPNVDNGSTANNNTRHQDNSAAASAQRQSNGRAGRGFGGAARGVYRTFARRATSEVVRSYKTAFEEILKQSDVYASGSAKWDIFPIDGDLNDLPISSLVFVREENNFSTVLILSLAATAGELGDRYINVGRDQQTGAKRQIALPQVPGDVWQFSSNFQKVAREEIDARLKGKAYRVIGNIVLPRDISHENTEILTSTVYRIIDNLENFLSYEGKFEVAMISLDQLLPNETLKSRIKFNKPQGIDSLGNPRREDVEVTIISQIGDGNEENGGSAIEVGRITGYVDAVHVGRREPQRGQTQWTLDNIQTFMPAFIITSLDSQNNAVTPESIVFTLAAASVIANENRWVSALRPSPFNEKHRFVGALACQLPLPGSNIQFDGKYEEWGKLENDASFQFQTFVSAAFEMDQSLIFIDIEESGELTPLQAMIVDIAYNNDTGALNAFLASMDNLTMSHTSRIYKEKGCPRLFGSTDLRLPLGKVRLDEHDDKQYDLRFVDQLHANVNEEDIAEIEEFNDAFYGLNASGEERTEAITRYLNARYTGLVEYTGYARRIQIFPELLEILDEAFYACKSPIEVDPNYDGYSTRRRGNNNFRATGYSATDSHVFTRSGGASRGNSRWGNMRGGWRSGN